MATLTDSGFPTLLNVLKRLHPGGSVETDIAEVLSKELHLLEDIPWVEGNLVTGHRMTERTALVSGTWRKLNQGLTAVKSETAQFDESCGMLEAVSKIDIDLAKLGGNPAAYRASEDAAFIEGLAQQFATAVWYENVTTNQERIHGLTPRYAASSGYKASSYVLPKGTLSGSNCHSIWLVTWAPGKVFGIYPKGSNAGLTHDDMGIQLVNDANSAQFRAYVSWHQWKCGLAVADYRYAVRMQWDVDDTTYFGDDDKGLYLFMQQMLNSIYKVTPQTRFYMDRTSKDKLDTQLAANSANFLEYVSMGGRQVPTFLGVPIRVTDALVAESAIS